MRGRDVRVKPHAESTETLVPAATQSQGRRRRRRRRRCQIRWAMLQTPLSRCFCQPVLRIWKPSGFEAQVCPQTAREREGRQTMARARANSPMPNTHRRQPSRPTLVPRLGQQLGRTESWSLELCRMQRNLRTASCRSCLFSQVSEMWERFLAQPTQSASKGLWGRGPRTGSELEDLRLRTVFRLPPAGGF